MKAWDEKRRNLSNWRRGIRLNFSLLSFAEMIVFCMVVNCYPPRTGREEGRHTLLVFFSPVYWEQGLVLSLIFMDVSRICRKESRPFCHAMSGRTVPCLFFVGSPLHNNGRQFVPRERPHEVAEPNFLRIYIFQS